MYVRGSIVLKHCPHFCPDMVERVISSFMLAQEYLSDYKAVCHKLLQRRPQLFTESLLQN